MSMTREEAITLLKYRRNIISSVDADWNANEIEAINFALSALRPVSREQVEKSWRGEWKENKNVAIESAICSKCKTVFQAYYGNYQFCPRCGAPMTDEAVEIVMERLEALNEKD